MSRKLILKWVDAFTSVPMLGNPCPVILNAEGLSPKLMQRITKEMNQPETAFLMPSKSCDLRARYFTPETEIPLAGHPTIASIHAAMEAKLISPGGRALIRLELNEGPIMVQIAKRGTKTLIKMFQRKPLFLQTHKPSEVLPLFGLNRSDLLPGTLIQTVSTGTRQLMVALRSLASLRKLRMDVDGYRLYRRRMNFFSPHFFCLLSRGATARTFARHLGVPPDTMEDAFTGSATGGMAAYLWKYGLLKKPIFIAEQGDWMGRPGRAVVEVVGPRDEIESVAVGGEAVTLMDGTLTI